MSERAALLLLDKAMELYGITRDDVRPIIAMKLAVVKDDVSLNCPCCGEDMFLRAEAWWQEDESEVCSDCGCRVGVRIDDGEEKPVAYTVVEVSCEGRCVHPQRTAEEQWCVDCPRRKS